MEDVGTVLPDRRRWKVPQKQTASGRKAGGKGEKVV